VTAPRLRSVLCGALAAAFLAVLLLGAGAAAETRIIQPTATPYHVHLDTTGKPIAFTVVASGFAPNANVFIVQCDGRAPSEPNWEPGRDCDPGTAPGAVSADAHGIARFDAANPNQKVLLTVGQSPEGIFNCTSPGTKPPSNGLRNFTTCQLRVSTNNTQATTDQVFLPIVFGDTSSGSSSTGWKAAVVIGGVVVLLIVAVALLLARRRTSSSTA